VLVGIVPAVNPGRGSLGVTGTPAFFVNGRFLNGAKPVQEFAKLINAELQRLNLPVPPAATAQAAAPAPAAPGRQ